MLYLLIQLSKIHPQILDLTVDYDSRPDEESENEREENEGKTKESSSKGRIYDGRKRDPRFADADRSSVWEIAFFLQHYHPTVSVYVDSLLEGKEQQKPDLGLFTLAHFLDRFVYKNSKQKPQTKGSSIMQPLGGAHTGELLVKATNLSNKEEPVNTENWLSKKLEDVRPEDKFFYEYFTSKQSKLRSSDRTQDKNDGGEAEELSDGEVWEALVRSKPDVEASSGDDLSDFDADDLSDMSDLDDSGDGEVVGQDNALADEQDEHDEDASGEDAAAASASDDDLDMFTGNQSDEYSSDEDAAGIAMLGSDGVSSDEDKEEDAAKTEVIETKRSSDGAQDGKKTKKQKLSSLPIFASAENYSQYLSSDDE